MVNYEYPPLGGGGGIAQQDIAGALAARHDIVVLTTHFRGLPRREVQNGVKIWRVPVWGRTHLPTATLRSMVTFAPAAFAVGLRVLREFRPEVIHACFAVPSGLPAIFLGRALGIPVVLTLVGADIFDPDPTAGIATHRHPAVRAVVRYVLQRADARTAISRDTKRRAMDYHHAPADIEVIPLGLVPPKEFPPEQRTDRSGPLRLITVGRLIPRKAHGDLLQAFAQVRRADVRLDVIGDGPLLPDLRQSAVALGISERVTFHGAVPEARKWELLCQADCYVSSSLYEGFGMVFLEAMYAGLPIIATDRGGQTDFLATGENALLVPPRQPAQLASALSWILRDDALRQRLADANRQKIHTFRIDDTVARYEGLFRRVIDRRAHHG